MGVGYANRNHIVWKNVNFEMMRWSLFNNGTKMRIAIGKKDDFAGSVYVYYIDENKHNHNTSYVTFELEYKKTIKHEKNYTLHTCNIATDYVCMYKGVRCRTFSGTI